MNKVNFVNKRDKPKKKYKKRQKLIYLECVRIWSVLGGPEKGRLMSDLKKNSLIKLVLLGFVGPTGYLLA
jgi:hypothetical protein